MEKMKIQLYADDTVIYTHASSLTKTMQELQIARLQSCDYFSIFTANDKVIVLIKRQIILI